MGAKEAKLKEQFLFAIVANKEGDVANFLKKYPDYVNTSLVENTTNPICRASYLGHQKLVSLLLKYGADINLRSSDGRTPLMWAAFRNNPKMVEFLLDNGADLLAEDDKGWTALDLCVIKMNYDAALALKRRGLQPKDKEVYMEHLWQKYDVEMFIQYLNEDREEVDPKRFFDLIKQQQEEWYSKDLVVDTRETWKNFFKRLLNFEDPPLIPREELPENKQPHRSFYGKISCFLNNIDPYPPRPREQLGNALDQTNTSFSQRAPLQEFIPPPTNLNTRVSASKQREDQQQIQQQDDDSVFQNSNMQANDDHVEGHTYTDVQYAINGEPEQRRSIITEERKSNTYVTVRQIDGEARGGEDLFEKDSKLPQKPRFTHSQTPKNNLAISMTFQNPMHLNNMISSSFSKDPPGKVQEQQWEMQRNRVVGAEMRKGGEKSQRTSTEFLMKQSNLLWIDRKQKLLRALNKQSPINQSQEMNFPQIRITSYSQLQDLPTSMMPAQFCNQIIQSKNQRLQKNMALQTDYKQGKIQEQKRLHFKQQRRSQPITDQQKYVDIIIRDSQVKDQQNKSQDLSALLHQDRPSFEALPILNHKLKLQGPMSQPESPLLPYKSERPIVSFNIHSLLAQQKCKIIDAKGLESKTKRLRSKLIQHHLKQKSLKYHKPPPTESPIDYELSLMGLGFYKPKVHRTPVFKIEGNTIEEEEKGKKQSPKPKFKTSMRRPESGDYEEWHRSSQRSSSVILEQHPTLFRDSSSKNE